MMVIEIATGIIAHSNTVFSDSTTYVYRLAPTAHGWRAEMNIRGKEDEYAWESCCYGIQPDEQACREQFARRVAHDVDRGWVTILDERIAGLVTAELASRREAEERREAERGRQEVERLATAEKLAARNATIAKLVGMLKGKKLTIAIPVMAGEERTVRDVAATVYGEGPNALAVHRRLDWDDKRRRGYSVTHVATGMLVADPLDATEQARALVALLLDRVEFDVFADNRKRKAQGAVKEQIALLRGWAGEYRRA